VCGFDSDKGVKAHWVSPVVGKMLKPHLMQKFAYQGDAQNIRAHKLNLSIY